MFLWRNKKNIDTFWLKKAPYQDLWWRNKKKVNTLKKVPYIIELHVFFTKLLYNRLFLMLLTLILLNNLISHTHFWLSANQITSYNFFVQIHKLNDKQCRSWSEGFFRSRLIWIYTVCKGRGCREQQDKGSFSPILNVSILNLSKILGHLNSLPYLS